jgi:hypothetical protein
MNKILASEAARVVDRNLTLNKFSVVVFFINNYGPYYSTMHFKTRESSIKNTTKFASPSLLFSPSGQNGLIGCCVYLYLFSFKMIIIM